MGRPLDEAAAPTRRSWRPLGLAALILASAVAAEADEGARLRIGVDPRDAPWAYIPGRENDPIDPMDPPALTRAEIGRLTGSDIAIARALGRRLGARIEFVPTAWVRLEAALVEKRVDLILNSWTPHEDTSAEIVASPPYAAWGLLVAVRAHDLRVRSPADLELARIGHIADPAVARALSSIGHGKFVTNTRSNLFRDLAKGELDAVIYDSPFVRWLVRRDARYRVLGTPLNRLGYHVGTRRADRELTESVARAVNEMVASGEAARLLVPWGGEPPETSRAARPPVHP